MAETQTDFHNLLFEVRDQVAHLTLNRPEAANAVNIELARELEAAELFCDQDPAVRAILLSGAGRRAPAAHITQTVTDQPVTIANK